MELVIDGLPSGYFIDRNLLGYNASNELIQSVFSFETFITWIQLPKIVVYDEFNQEIILFTNGLNITHTII